jgi:hypothetical protein
MATLGTALRRVLSQTRSLPGRLGLRPHTVELVTASWSGDHTGDGTETAVESTLIHAAGQPPRVHWLSSEEITVGNLPSGTVQIGPLTPTFVGGGVSRQAFGRLLDAGDTIHLRITGPRHPDGALYRVTNAHQENATEIMLQAIPVMDSTDG